MRNVKLIRPISFICLFDNFSLFSRRFQQFLIWNFCIPVSPPFPHRSTPPSGIGNVSSDMICFISYFYQIFQLEFISLVGQINSEREVIEWESKQANVHPFETMTRLMLFACHYLYAENNLFREVHFINMIQAHQWSADRLMRWNAIGLVTMYYL